MSRQTGLRRDDDGVRRDAIWISRTPGPGPLSSRRHRNAPLTVLLLRRVEFARHVPRRVRLKGKLPVPEDGAYSRLRCELGAGMRGLRPGPREPGPLSTLTRLATPLKDSLDARCVFSSERFRRRLRLFWISQSPPAERNPLRCECQGRRTLRGERLTAPGEGEIPIKRLSRRAVSRSLWLNCALGLVQIGVWRKLSRCARRLRRRKCLVDRALGSRERRGYRLA
jgi:hypothetical protein